VEAIKRVVRAESDAYFRRDSHGWQRTWVHDSSATLTVVSGEGVSVSLGWEKIGPPQLEFFKNNPTPEAIKLEDVNHRIHIEGALAFAEYDQRATYLPDTTVLDARQHRALVKRNGEWKIYSSSVFLSFQFSTHPRSIEYRIGTIAQSLSRASRQRDAIEVDKLNAQLFPNSPRVYQALGEAYLAAGETKLAIQNHEKALALDPKNEASKAALAKLAASKSP
jgi:tetratricopeptide (TPR) repeat protein